VSFNPPKDWSKESADLYIHKSGVRITKMTYQGQEGWYIVPVDLDAPVVPFAATDEGREKAFAAVAGGLAKINKAAKKAEQKKVKEIKLPKRGEEEEGEPGEGDAEARPRAGEGEAAEAEEKDEEDEDEEDEAETPG